MIIPNTTEIMPYQSIVKLVNDYNEAIKRLKAAYALLDQSQTLLKSLVSYPHVLPENRSLYDAVSTLNRIVLELKADAWRGVLEKTQATKFMTSSRYENFERSLKEPKSLPEITVETVHDFVENLVTSAPDMLLEFIKETFDWLKPGVWSAGKYKTNQKSQYEITEKVIKENLFDTYLCEPTLRYGYSEQAVKAMDNAFHLMDGKGIAKNGSSAYNAIKEAERDKKMEAETEFFLFKWYKNGNCHIKFNRMDLVNKMNQIAGENILKP